VEDQIATLIAAGVSGVYTNGTACEFYAQSEAEFDRLSELVASACERANKPFQLGASHLGAQLSLCRARRAADLKPGAIQVILPEWTRPDLEESVAFLNRIGEAVSPVPLVLYNPPHAGHLLTPEEFVTLAERCPSLAGVKVAGGDDSWYRAMTPMFQRLSVFIPGHQLATGVRLGASGAYSNVACLSPSGAVRWEQQMARDMPAALELETRILTFMHEHILPLRDAAGYSNQALDKLLAAIGGWAPIGTRLRWPYRWIDEGTAAELRIAAKRIVPEMFQ
jgi:dihydrodipicolinate synthase/N-acetylneuraminate lyase